MAPKEQYIIYAIGACKKYIIKGESDNAIIDPTETYLVEYVIIPHTMAIINPAIQLRARIVPTPDATDFPPLNCKNIDLLCPIITAIAAIIGAIPMEVPTVANILAKITGKAPFKASRNITKKK